MTVVGVLLGAGEILPAHAVNRLSRLAVDVLGITSDLEPGLSAEEIAVRLAVALEDSPLTNCGLGSELNLTGEVECDACLASIKNSRLGHAAVGAVPHVANPIKVCELMLQRQGQPSRTATPTFLAGNGAQAYAAQAGLTSRDLKTESTRRRFERYRGDTIGVFVMQEGEVAVASSSGGALLKDPGRIGPAAQYGAALFATEKTACLCSGFGEDIAAFQLAREGAVSEDLAELAGKMQSHIQMQRDPFFGVIRAESYDTGIQVDWVLKGASSMVAAVFTTPNGPIHVINESRPGMGGISLPYSTGP